MRQRLRRARCRARGWSTSTQNGIRRVCRAVGEDHEPGDVAVRRRAVDRGGHGEPAGHRDRSSTDTVTPARGCLQRRGDRPRAGAAAGVGEVDRHRAAVDRERDRASAPRRAAGLSARTRSISPPPSRSTETSRPRSSRTGVAGLDERRLDLRDRPVAGAAASAARPRPRPAAPPCSSRTSRRTGPAWFTGSDEVIATPGARDVRLQLQRDRGGAARREVRDRARRASSPRP